MKNLADECMQFTHGLVLHWHCCLSSGVTCIVTVTLSGTLHVHSTSTHCPIVCEMCCLLLVVSQCVECTVCVRTKHIFHKHKLVQWPFQHTCSFLTCLETHSYCFLYNKCNYAYQDWWLVGASACSNLPLPLPLPEWLRKKLK